jgi:hypothetical protein
MTGATSRRAKDHHTLAWLEAHPALDGEDVPERWGN